VRHDSDGDGLTDSHVDESHTDPDIAPQAGRIHVGHPQHSDDRTIDSTTAEHRRNARVPTRVGHAQ